MILTCKIEYTSAGDTQNIHLHLHSIKMKFSIFIYIRTQAFQFSGVIIMSRL